MTDPLTLPPDEFAAVKRVRALAQSWASLPPEDDPRRERAAEVDRHVGVTILGMLDSSTAADVALSRAAAVAESWLAPGGLGLFYPAAGQAVLDAIRGASTEEEAGWRERAERAERKLAEITAVCCSVSSPIRHRILAIIGTEGDEGRGH